MPAALSFGAGQTTWASQAGEPSPHSVQPMKDKDSASWASKKCRRQAGLPGGLGLSRFLQAPRTQPSNRSHPGGYLCGPNGLTLCSWEGKLGSLLSPGAGPVCVVAVRPSGRWGPAAAGNPRPGLSARDRPAWGRTGKGEAGPQAAPWGLRLQAHTAQRQRECPQALAFRTVLAGPGQGGSGSAQLPPHPERRSPVPAGPAQQSLVSGPEDTAASC